jgi:hypothetical protein
LESVWHHRHQSANSLRHKDSYRFWLAVKCQKMGAGSLKPAPAAYVCSVDRCWCWIHSDL